MTYNTDSITGQQVRQHLIDQGVETPYTPKKINRDRVEELFAEIHREVGMDLTDDSIVETPRRLAKLYSEREFFAGLDYDNFPKATVVENKMRADEMVLERNIKVSSLCEHHWLPIVGTAFVAYIPNEKVLGLSKLNRVVDFFCRRPQIQERLTLQIYHAFSYLLDTENVAVVIQAEHMCVKLRGVEDPCSDTTTSKLGGVFKRPEVRAEFISLSKGLGKGDL
jgi:GTP cyclohydrolase I